MDSRVSGEMCFLKVSHAMFEVQVDRKCEKNWKGESWYAEFRDTFGWKACVLVKIKIFIYLQFKDSNGFSLILNIFQFSNHPNFGIIHVVRMSWKYFNF